METDHVLGKELSRRAVRASIVAMAMFAALTAFEVGCAKTPPQLSPQGKIDFQTVQLGKDLDVIRDFAQEASKQTPPVLSRDVAVRITQWHKAAVTALAARTPDWKKTILDGIDPIVQPLPDKDKQLLMPYVTLIKSVLASL